MKKTLILAIGLVILLTASYFTYKIQHSKKIIHYHAGFQVYVDGKLEDFSLAKYMSVKPCSNKEVEETENEQLEKAHLHDNIGNVVHVEAENSKWNDLFRNIKFAFPPEKLITGYVNGNKTDNILDYPIRAYDSVVIFVGKVDEKLLKTAVTKEEIKKAEKTSESC